MFRHSLCHPQGEIYHISKPSAYCKIVRVTDVKIMKYIIYTELFRSIKTIWSRSYGLNFFKILKTLV